jgi:subtilisin family serine protease
MPSATPEELATAIIDCVEAGAHIINLSAAISHSSSKGEWLLQQALDHCGKRNVIVVAASGNQGTVGSSSITRHPWVIPVVACDLRGRPLQYSNLGNSIGRRGLSAPAEGVTSLGPDGRQQTFAGTSAAAPFVTGAIALLRSEFPALPVARIRFALMQGATSRRATIVPTRLNAWGAYQILRRIKA